MFMVSRRSINAITVAAVSALVALTGCSDKKPTSSSSGGGSDSGLDGTWAAVALQLIAGDSIAQETSYQADSSRYYLELNGSAVMMHLLVDDGGGDEASLVAGTYAGDSVAFTGGSYAVSQSGSDLRLTAVDSTEGGRVRYVFNRYEGTVPPAFWPDYTSVDDDAYEPDDSLGAATALVDGRSAQTHTVPSSDQDWFMLTLQAGRQYALGFGVDADELTVSFFDSGENRIWLDGYGDVGITAGSGGYVLVAEFGATVYVRVRSGSAGVYAIALVSTVLSTSPYAGTYYLAAETRSLASAVYFDTTYTTATAPVVVSIGLTMAKIYEYEDYVIDSSTVEVEYISDTHILYDGDTAACALSGSALIIEWTWTVGTGTVVQRQTFQPYTGQLPPSAWLSGPAVPAGAVTLSVDGASLDAALSEAGEEDWYTFVVSAGGTYTIATSGDTDTKMSLFLQDGSSLSAVDDDDDGGSGWNASISFEAAAAATYYAVVTGFGGEIGGYGISVVTGQGVALYKETDAAPKPVKARSPFSLRR